MTRWADRFLPFGFDILHISGCKLGIVDYLSRFLTFEALRPSNFDVQYVVKCSSRFFDACNCLDRWVQDCSSSEVLTDGLSATSGNGPVNALTSSINSFELGYYCQARDNYPDQDTLLDLASSSILSSGVQPVEGVGNLVLRNSTQEVKPLEGGCSVVNFSNELFNQINCFNSFVTSPLEGVQIVLNNSVQSALSWFNSLAVIFTACVPNYLPVWICIWLFSTVIFELGIFPYFIGIIWFHITFCTYWCLFFFLGH